MESPYPPTSAPRGGDRATAIAIVDFDSKSMIVKRSDDHRDRRGVPHYVRDEFTDHDQSIIGDRLGTIDTVEPGPKGVTCRGRGEVGVAEFEAHRLHGCHVRPIPHTGVDHALP